MEFVDLYAQYLTIKEEIDAAIAGVIRQSDFIGGPHVEAFEAAYAERMDLPHCVSCANGTDAIYIALQALGIGPGDEVIVPAHTWISTSETVTQAGGEVVFCDSEEATFTMDPARLAELVTPRTKGIIAVHLYGQPADMDPILEIARQHDLWVIEDCAQAHFAQYKGRTVGTMGDAATFSFYPGKNLGAMGDAGALVTARDDVAEFARLYARHGGKGVHRMEGINSRLDGLQAAILNVKLGYIDQWTAARQERAERYDALLADVPGLTLPARRRESTHVFHLYVVRTPRRDALRQHLADRGIPTVINYPRALPFYPAYERLGHTAEDFPVAHRHQHEILSLPIYPEMTEAQQEEVATEIKRFFEDAEGVEG